MTYWGPCNLLRERVQARHCGIMFYFKFSSWGEGSGGEVENAIQEKHVRSMPAENAFSKAEARTATQTVISSAIRSNAETYNAFVGRQLNGCGRGFGRKDLRGSSV